MALAGCHRARRWPDAAPSSRRRRSPCSQTSVERPCRAGASTDLLASPRPLDHLRALIHAVVVVGLARCASAGRGGGRGQPASVSEIFSVSSGTKGRAGFGRAPKAFWASSTSPWRHARTVSVRERRRAAADDAPQFHRAVESRSSTPLPLNSRASLARRVLAGLSATAGSDNVGKARNCRLHLPTRVFASRRWSLRVRGRVSKVNLAHANTRFDSVSREKCEDFESGFKIQSRYR